MVLAIFGFVVVMVIGSVAISADGGGKAAWVLVLMIALAVAWFFWSLMNTAQRPSSLKPSVAAVLPRARTPLRSSTPDRHTGTAVAKFHDERDIPSNAGGHTSTGETCGAKTRIAMRPLCRQNRAPYAASCFWRAPRKVPTLAGRPSTVTWVTGCRTRRGWGSA